MTRYQEQDGYFIFTHENGFEYDIKMDLIKTSADLDKYILNLQEKKWISKNSIDAFKDKIMGNIKLREAA